jgi:NADPH:quinone reductase-like Zn-dependent oxidoreductase
MKAFRFETYGSPDVLKLVDVEKPTPSENQILVKVYSSSVNPLDWHRMRADPILARLAQGFFKPKDTKIGADVAGVVVSVGSNVTKFKPGDEVFGFIGTGAFAEYAVSNYKNFAHKPKNISFEQAGAVGVAALTALQSLRGKWTIEHGQKVLVNGASGGVGSFGVQIAKAFGAEVTAVCSTRNIELVRSIGADHVIDYTKEDFTKSGKQYNFILDAIANHSPFAVKRALKPGGIIAVAGFTKLSYMLMTALFAGRGDKKAVLILANNTSEDMEFLGELLESCKIVPLIDKCYAFEQIPDAIRYVETLRARGKVVIKVEGGK